MEAGLNASVSPVAFPCLADIDMRAHSYQLWRLMHCAALAFQAKKNTRNDDTASSLKTLSVVP